MRRQLSPLGAGHVSSDIAVGHPGWLGHAQELPVALLPPAVLSHTGPGQHMAQQIMVGERAEIFALC